MNVIDMLRDATARRTALFTYARSFDRFSYVEQANQNIDPAEAERAHVYALIALRAYRAELDDQDCPE